MGGQHREIPCPQKCFLAPQVELHQLEAVCSQHRWISGEFIHDNPR